MAFLWVLLISVAAAYRLRGAEPLLFCFALLNAMVHATAAMVLFRHRHAAHKASDLWTGLAVLSTLAGLLLLIFSIEFY